MSDIIKRMNSLLSISSHSFVDLITNSSSELFVCDGRKTVEAVKEILQTLLETHDRISGESNTFENVFGQIEIADYTFQWWDVPEDVRENYKQYHSYALFERYPYGMGISSQDSEEKKTLQEKDREIGQRIGIWEEDLYDKSLKEYNRRWKKYRKEVDKLWTDYGSRSLISEFDLFYEFLRQNGVSNNQINGVKKVCRAAVKEHIENNYGEHRRWSMSLKMTKKMTELFEKFQFISAWGITCKKGDILVKSNGDNSIPWALMDSISSYLSAKRYHLG